jgi:HK97 family phage prohead protease
MNPAISKDAKQRAYSFFDFKEFDEDTREILGIASTPTPDRYQDIVEPKGAEYNLPIPLLWQHDSWSPVGHVTKAKATNAGIEVVMKLAKLDEPGPLKARLDEAWQSVKLKLVRGLSIGFSALEYTYLPDTGGIHFLKWDWLELSLVTIPANAEATITGFKSVDERVAFIKRLDRQQRAASGPITRAPVTLVSTRDRGNDGSIKLISRRHP